MSKQESLPIEKVTREHAEAVLEEVKKKYANYLPDFGTPVISQGNWGRTDNDNFSIDWEEGPEDWALTFQTSQPGLYTEPYNSFASMICTIPF